MGLFGIGKNSEPKEPVKCDVCGNTTSGVVWKAKDGVVCYDCIKKAKIGTTPKFFQTFSIDSIKNVFERKDLKSRLSFENVGPLLVNYDKRFWSFQKAPSPLGVPAAEMLDTFWLMESPLFEFDEIEGIRIIFEGNTVQTVGNPSSIIAPQNKKAKIQMLITVGGYINKTYQLFPSNTDSYMTFLDLFCTMMNTKTPNPVIRESVPLADAIGKAVAENMKQATDTTDEIRKYKSLLDDGVITKEEFEVKKKQLLNL